MPERLGWSDDQLDGALRELRPCPEPGGPAQQQARARLLAALAGGRPTPLEPAHEQREPAPALRVVGASRPRTPQVGRWGAGARGAVAAVAVLAAMAGVLLAQGPTPEVRSAAHLAAAEQLRVASAASGSPDPATSAGPGFQYVVTRSHDLSSAWTSTGAPLSAFVETRTELWIPGDRAAEWLRVEQTTPTGTFVVGSAELARAEGDGGLFAGAGTPVVERGPCGDFPGLRGELGAADGPAVPCAERAGTWLQPTPAFLAALPRDPRLLLDRLRQGSGGTDPDAEAFLAASELLRSQQAPDDVRAAVFAALAELPRIELGDQAADLAGRRGTAIGLVVGNLRDEIVIDPATGAFLGQRTVLVRPTADVWAGVPVGTVVSWTSVSTSVVEAAGQRAGS